MKPAAYHGLLVLDKPRGITSRDAVDRALPWFPRGTRVGHTGTLDPLATGVLVLCVGWATRLTEYVQKMAKVYRAGILLGARSDTDDADGTVTPVECAGVPSEEAVRAALTGFLGEQRQVPPAYSAAKVTGQRAYDLARRGEEVSLSARPVTIHAIDVLRYAYPRLEVEVRCGKGTYIRSLARDLGEQLGCGGLIETLRRLRVGPFDTNNAVPLDADAPTARARLLPMALAAAELPRVSVSREAVPRLRQGQRVAAGGMSSDADEVAVYGPGDEFLGIGRAARRQLVPLKILPSHPA